MIDDLTNTNIVRTTFRIKINIVRAFPTPKFFLLVIELNVNKLINSSFSMEEGDRHKIIFIAQ